MRRVVLTSGTGLLGTGRFLLGSKTDASGRTNGEEWWTLLFVPLVPLRSLSLSGKVGGADGLPAVVEDAGPLPREVVLSRLATSAAGVVAVGLALGLIDASSSNTGLVGGLLVVVGGGLLVAAGGLLDCLRPRVGACEEERR